MESWYTRRGDAYTGGHDARDYPSRHWYDLCLQLAQRSGDDPEFGPHECASVARQTPESRARNADHRPECAATVLTAPADQYRQPRRTGNTKGRSGLYR